MIMYGSFDAVQKPLGLFNRILSMYREQRMMGMPIGFGYEYS